jgi:hypothetical protein
MKAHSAFEEISIDRVQDYWNSRPCNIRHSTAPVGAKEYFDQVEARKYFVEYHIPGLRTSNAGAAKKSWKSAVASARDTINFALAGAQVPPWTSPKNRWSWRVSAPPSGATRLSCYGRASRAHVSLSRNGISAGCRDRYSDSWNCVWLAPASCHPLSLIAFRCYTWGQRL